MTFYCKNHTGFVAINIVCIFIGRWEFFHKLSLAVTIRQTIKFCSMTSLEQIDFVFFHIKSKIQYGGSYGYQNIWFYVEATPETKINPTLLKEILKRLIEDGLVTETIYPETQPVYHVTFKGVIFDGYNKSYLELREKEQFDDYTQKQNTRNGEYLNRLTLILAIVTSIAAIYYILEIFNNFFSIYPKK